MAPNPAPSISSSAGTGTPKAGHYRWLICAILFVATTINYVDRNVLSFTMLDVIYAKKIGTTQSAQISIVVLRARFTDQPIPMKRVASQPKNMLPPSEIR